MSGMGSSFDPMPTAGAPARYQGRRDSTVGSTPPVGIARTQGQGARTASRNAGPPIEHAGNSLTRSHPARYAARISVTVAQPGTYGMLRRWQAPATSAENPGANTKFTPRSITCAAVAPYTIDTAPALSS